MGVGGSGRREYIRKRCRRVNMVKYYVLMYENKKMRPETNPGKWGGWIKENDGRMDSTMIYYKNFCKCHNVFPVQ
jgi:hypothetical protein